MAVQIKVTSDSRQAQADIKRLESSLQSVEQSAQQINKSINSLASIAKFAFAAIPLAAVGAGAIRTAASFEKLSARLDIVTNDARKTQAALAGIQKIVVATPFSVQALTDAYARLAATGSNLFQSQSQIERGIRNIADAVAAVGGGNVELQNVSRAFERASSEGRITAERLNQLVDAGIPLTKVARALGLSMEELRMETEKGTFSFGRFFDAFQKVAESADGFGGAATRQVNTLNGAFSNLNDALSILADRAIRQSGVSALLVRGIVGLTNSINKFSEGIDVSVLVALNRLTAFYLQANFLLDDLVDLFVDSGKTIKRSLETTFSSLANFQSVDIDLELSIKDYALNLSKFLPSLESVKQKITDFGTFVKDVFFSIYDAVVGNSYWPDMIDGVVNGSATLLSRVKPHLEEFKTFVSGVFSSLQKEYDTLFSELKIKINTSSDTGVLGQISNAMTKISASLDSLVNSAKKYSFIEKLFDKIEQLTKYLIDIESQISPEVWKTVKFAFDSITAFTKQGLPRLLAAIGVTKTVSDTANTEEAQGFADKIAKQVKEVTKESSQDFSTIGSEFEKIFKGGIVFSELFRNIYNEAGEFIGRSLARIFGDEVTNQFDTNTNIKDALITLVALALSAAFRKVFIISAVLNFVTGDQPLSTVLSKVFDEIANFGNRVLKGAGIEGFDGSVSGFIAGILFGGLTLGLLTGRLFPLLGQITKALLSVFVLKRIFGGAGQEGEARSLGSRLGGFVGAAFRLSFLALGAFIGSQLGDKIISTLGIEDNLTKFFIQAGTITATAFIGSFLASGIIIQLSALFNPIIAAWTAKLVAFRAAGLLLASKLVAGIVATLLSLPVLIAAAVVGIAFILQEVFTGKEGGWGAKVRDWFKNDLVPYIGGVFKDLWKEVAEGFKSIIVDPIKNFFKAKPGDSSSPEGGTSGFGFANGGNVRGPGTGRSDSILARLSNGEFVVNARATSENRSLLERINNGLPAFADGGFIGSHIKKQEDNISRVYHDNRKLLTVGVGHLLGSAEANKVPTSTARFLSGFTATKEKNVYPKDSFLSKLNYKPYTDSAIESLFAKDLSKHIGIARRAVPNFDSLNKYAQTALVDHAFQLGNLKQEWPKFTSAVANRDYARAVKELQGTPLERQTPNRVKARIGLLSEAARLDKVKGFASGGFVGERDPFKGVSPSSLGGYYSSLLSESEGYFSSLLGSARFLSNPLAKVFGKRLDEELIDSKDGEYDILNQRVIRPNLLSAGLSEFADFFAIGIHEYGHVFDIVPKLIEKIKGGSSDKESLTKNILSEYNVLDREYAASKTALGFTLPERLQNFVIPELVESLQSYFVSGIRVLSNGGPNIFSGLTKEMLDFVDDGSVNNSVNSGVFRSILSSLKANDIESFVSQLAPFLGAQSPFLAFANGGKVSGPGTGRSDSILARLSNGEFVVNARDAKRNRGLLERINNGLPAFANGGSVDLTSIGGSNEGFDFSLLTRSARVEANQLIKEIRRQTVLFQEASLRGDKYAAIAYDRLQESTKALSNKIAPAVIKSAEELQFIKESQFAQTGRQAATDFRGQVGEGFKGLLKGELDFAEFGDQLANSFSNKVLDTFADQFITSIFKSGGLDSLFENIFTGQAALGDTLGGLGAKAVKPIADPLTKLFGGGQGPSGTPSNPVSVRMAESVSTTIEDAGFIPDLGESINEFTTRQQFGTDAGSEQTKMLAEQMEGFNEVTPSLFGDLTSNLSNIFTDLPGSLSGIFSTLTGSLGSLLGGLFSGGGGSIGGLFTAGLSLFGFASGGFVSGRGSSTSDSIPALLSNGEYVINARATSKVKPLLDAINSGKIPKYATGGIVGTGNNSLISTSIGIVNPSESSMQSRSEQVFNINITGDVSNQTRSEIARMLPQIANSINSYNKEKSIRT
jgi:tape measure domain-containing protein